MPDSTDPRSFAVTAHGDQRYGERPYVEHLDHVASLLRRHVPDDPMLDALVAVAYLHDVVEDTPVTEDEVRARFGEVVATGVAGLTDPPGANRAARKAILNERLAALDAGRPGHRATLIVKAADRLANVEACRAHDPGGMLAKYRAEHPGFHRAAYRPGLCDPLWAAIDAELEG